MAPAPISKRSSSSGARTMSSSSSFKIAAACQYVPGIRLARSIACFMSIPHDSVMRAQHMRSGAREEERLMTVVVPADDVVLTAMLDPHLEDLALPRSFADVNAV